MILTSLNRNDHFFCLERRKKIPFLGYTRRMRELFMNFFRQLEDSTETILHQFQVFTTMKSAAHTLKFSQRKRIVKLTTTDVLSFSARDIFSPTHSLPLIATLCPCGTLASGRFGRFGYFPLCLSSCFSLCALRCYRQKKDLFFFGILFLLTL